jgi:hypothetical protein
MSTTWKDKVKAAHEMIHALCQPRGSAGSREWIMSIPARPDYDPDLVITSGLRAAAKEIDRLAAEVDARDEVIAEILAMLKPGEMPKYCSFDFQHKYRELYKEWQWKTALHARACEIAGRTE